jgi:hypothetical protein
MNRTAIGDYSNCCEAKSVSKTLFDRNVAVVGVRAKAPTQSESRL